MTRPTRIERAQPREHAMRTLAPPSPNTQPHRARLTKAQRIARKHDELETLIDAHRRHGVPATDLWLAMIQLEDQLRIESPRSYSHWLAIWLLHRPVGTHPRGGYSDSCPLCQPVRQSAQGKAGTR